MKQATLLSLLFFFCQNVFSQIAHEHVHDRAIHFPDLPGYRTLVCDFHQHTVFSDGSVWPDIRVGEALRDSVDAISLTEHLEYQPHKKDLPHPDRNRAYELAEKSARPYGLIVVKGAEITRRMPPGHCNAIFIEDANKLLIEDSLEVFKEAQRQGAFTFWNHPNWIAQYADGIARLTGFHKKLLAEGLLQGIEVVNDLTFSDEALQIALDYNLTIMGTSDIHGLVDWQYGIPEGGHRPVTLVFAKEKTAAAIKEGLQKRRTVVWFNNTLVGREEWLSPLIGASVSVEKSFYQGAAAIMEVHLKNDSDVEFILRNESGFGLHNGHGIVQLHPNTTTKIEVKTLEQLEAFTLKFRVLNAVTAPRANPVLEMEVFK
ncbi:MAG TPA: PHP domain-containing protein [Bacteroidetes bacterium]|nr:PHP domain-containing protein [Bacteroidota bacterium]